MHWEGWERWGNWHSLQLMSTLCRKIHWIWCYKAKYEPLPPDHVRTDMFGPGWSPTGRPGGWNHNSWGRNSFRASPREKTVKVRGGPESLARQTLGSTIHEATFQTFYPLTAASWAVHKGLMSSSQPVWQNEGIFETIVLPPLADSLWFDPQVNHHELLRRSSFFRSPEVYFESHLWSEESYRHSSLKFKG